MYLVSDVTTHLVASISVETSKFMELISGSDNKNQVIYIADRLLLSTHILHNLTSNLILCSMVQTKQVTGGTSNKT